MEDFKNRRLHFAYAWPLKSWPEPEKFRVTPPFQKAAPWQCSVYYYWWEYLRRHDGYRRTCDTGGKGKYAKLYEDFGNVHEGEFWPWWRSHSWLFAEPAIRQVVMANDGERGDERTLILRVPLETKLSLLTGQFKRLVKPQLERAARTKWASGARYPVATKPVLTTLHEHLMVWDAKKKHPEIKDAELADLVGLRINHVVNGDTVASLKISRLSTDAIEQKIYRRKQLAVQRHLRIAEQYIENVALGRFPYREGR
jgi:hypothetical protein